MNPVPQTVVGLRFFLEGSMPVTVIMQKDEAVAIARSWQQAKDYTQRLGGVDVNGHAWGVLSSAVRAVFTVAPEQLLREQGLANQQTGIQQTGQPWHFRSGN